jgi:hypothetical protein
LNLEVVMKISNYAMCAWLLTFAAAGLQSVRAADDPPASAPADTTLAGDQARAVKAAVKRDAKVVAEAAKEGAQQVATTAKEVAHEVATASKEGAQQVAASAKRGGTAVKATVTGNKPAAPAAAAPPPPPPPPKPANPN